MSREDYQSVINGSFSKIAMLGSSSLAQNMTRQSSNISGYRKGGPVRKDGYLTDKKLKPYARVHKGERVVPAKEKKASVGRALLRAAGE